LYSIESHLQAKITTVQNQFKRELRKKRESKTSGAVRDNVYTPKWSAFNHLQFLLPVVNIHGVSNSNLVRLIS
jgi:hypothetical protein